MGGYSFRFPAALVKMDKIVEALALPMDFREVAAVLHTHPQTASRYLWHMVRLPLEEKRIYISGWIEDEKTFRKIPQFRAGNKPNKRKPAPLTYQEVFQRIQADPVRHAKRMAKYRAEWHKAKGRTPPPSRVASPFAALGL